MSLTNPATIQARVKALGTELGRIDATVLHYWHPRQAAPYILWQEDSCDTFKADNKSAERKWVGVVDLYTQTEYDDLLDDIVAALENVGAVWKISSVDYEDETNLIHFTFDWELM